ncbi:unnamed protein product [Polarella glacialis]|uniref:Uncharacterized protein n=1 Tax=Polarella glacialis TaxID=89957 RepID=A0A813DE83_POLGL|nr:unnamed protein product [Polarella glacialis]
MEDCEINLPCWAPETTAQETVLPEASGEAEEKQLQSACEESSQRLGSFRLSLPSMAVSACPGPTMYSLMFNCAKPVAMLTAAVAALYASLSCKLVIIPGSLARSAFLTALERHVSAVKTFLLPETQKPFQHTFAAVRGLANRRRSPEAAAKGAATETVISPCRVKLLLACGARRLLMQQSGRRRASMVAGVKVEIDRQKCEVAGSYNKSGKGGKVTSSSRIAIKYLRLQLFARHGWVPEREIRDDADLTVMQVPESVLNFVSGKSGSFLQAVTEEANALAFFIDDGQPSTSSPSAPRAAAPWLEAGKRVEVRKSHDIRSGWQVGTVRAVLRNSSMNVDLDSGGDMRVEADQARPYFDLEAAVEVCDATGAAWRPAVVVSRIEALSERRLLVRFVQEGVAQKSAEEPQIEKDADAEGEKTVGEEGLEGLAEEKQASDGIDEQETDGKQDQEGAAEVSTKCPERQEEELEVDVWQVRWRTQTGESSTTQDPGTEPPVAEEPVAEVAHRLAIFGDFHARCQSQVRFMSSIATKLPGHFLNREIHWQVPEGLDWDVDLVELSPSFKAMCIGQGGSMRRKLCTACGCCIDYVGATAFILGSQQSRGLAVALLEVLRNAERGFVHQVPLSVEEHCERVVFPQEHSPFLTGKSRSLLNQLEENGGFISFYEADEVVQAAPGDNSENTNVAQGQNEEASEDAAVKAWINASEKASEDAAWKAPEDAAWKASEAAHRTLLIIALSPRSRQIGRLRVEMTIEKAAPGYYTTDWATATSSSVGPGLDVVDFPKDFSWPSGFKLGHNGSDRTMIEAAANCAIELLGHRIALAGTGEERSRAQQYLQWFVTDLRLGGKRQLQLSAAELHGRDDLSIVTLSSEERMILDEEALKVIQLETGTMLFWREVPVAEFFCGGSFITLSRGGRDVRAEVVEATGSEKEGETLSLQLKILPIEAQTTASSSDTEDLLVFGHDAGPSGFQGRSLAERKVQDFIADARATASAATAATASAEPWPDQASVATDWNKDASQWHDDRKPTSRQGSSGLRSREGQDTGRWSGSSDEKGGNDKNKDNAWDQWTDQKDLGNTWKADSSGAGSGWDARSEGNSSTWGRTSILPRQLHVPILEEQLLQALPANGLKQPTRNTASADDTKAAWANWNPSSTEAPACKMTSAPHSYSGGGKGGGGGDVRPGDWACGKCGANIFASKVECFKCGTPKAPACKMTSAPHSYSGGGKGGGGGDVRPGDWACGKCGANIFASKVECFKCGTPKEGGGGRDKDWNDRGSDLIGLWAGVCLPRYIYFAGIALSSALFAGGGSFSTWSSSALWLGYYGIKGFPQIGSISLYTFAAESYPVAARATGTAVVIGVGRIGAVLAPLVYQGLHDATGSHQAFFILVAALAAFSALPALAPPGPGRWRRIVEETNARLPFAASNPSHGATQGAQLPRMYVIGQVTHRLVTLRTQAPLVLCFTQCTPEATGRVSVSMETSRNCKLGLWSRLPLAQSHMRWFVALSAETEGYGGVSRPHHAEHFCDVSLRSTDGQVFKAHRLLLSMASDPLFAMLSGSFSEGHGSEVLFDTWLHLITHIASEHLTCFSSRLWSAEDCSADALSAFLEFLYKGTASVKKDEHMTPELCSQLIVDCEEVSTKGEGKGKLKAACPNLHLDTKVAEVLLVDELDEVLEDYVLEHFSECVKTEEFSAWPLHRMIGLLQSDDLVAENEEEVLSAVLHWHRSKCGRDDATAALLQMVRFPLLSAVALQGLRSTGLTGLPGIVVSRLAAAALKFHSAPQLDLGEVQREGEKELKLNLAAAARFPKLRNCYPYWWADFGCSIKGGTVAERPIEEPEGELEPWAVHIHENSYIIDGREPCCVLQWPFGAEAGTLNGVNDFTDIIDIAIDAAGDLYVLDGHHGRIVRIRDGVGEVVGEGQLTLDIGTRALYLGADGSIYYIDEGGSRVQRFFNGITTTVAGGQEAGCSQAHLEDAEDIFVTLDGTLYVSDSGNNRIQKWAPGATHGITVAGGNGKGSALHQLQHPVGLHVTEDGAIFVADYQNHRVMKWRDEWLSGHVVAGGHGADSGLHQLFDPIDVTFDDAGSLYVADNGNARVLKWGAPSHPYEELLPAPF